MISHLKGTVIHKDSGYLVLETGNVGYKIFATGNTLEVLGEEASLWTHLVIREDAQTLYGFASREELDFFELLISVSGIGPKTALGILNSAPTETLKQAIRRANIAHLVKVGGIGKKNAEKIVIELQEKMGVLDKIPEDELRAEEDAVEALSSLGYPSKDAREALKAVSEDITGTSARIKEALKILGKNA